MRGTSTGQFVAPFVCPFFRNKQLVCLKLVVAFRGTIIVINCYNDKTYTHTLTPHTHTHIQTLTHAHTITRTQRKSQRLSGQLIRN